MSDRTDPYHGARASRPACSSLGSRRWPDRNNHRVRQSGSTSSFGQDVEVARGLRPYQQVAGSATVIAVPCWMRSVASAAGISGGNGSVPASMDQSPARPTPPAPLPARGSVGWDGLFWSKVDLHLAGTPLRVIRCRVGPALPENESGHGAGLLAVDEVALAVDQS